GRTRLRPLLDAMEADWELVIRTGPDGEQLFDLDGLDIVDADVPAPVRFLAPYDNVIVAQADRRRIADDDRYRRLLTANGRYPGFVLIDGRLAGSWRVEDGRVVADMMIDLPRGRRAELEAERQRLQQFCDTRG
ncbi:winged helix DNA-binding domain-containing protein, partial [Streptomyces sp. SID10244]|nr:winged helix DNA-binding domain-containing protein [Streptomyces sp. SID10244]